MAKFKKNPKMHPEKERQQLSITRKEDRGRLRRETKNVTAFLRGYRSRIFLKDEDILKLNITVQSLGSSLKIKSQPC
jgi:hypothetical protein